MWGGIITEYIYTLTSSINNIYTYSGIIPTVAFFDLGNLKITCFHRQSKPVAMLVVVFPRLAGKTLDSVVMDASFCSKHRFLGGFC